jgi:hypothetical protein
MRGERTLMAGQVGWSIAGTPVITMCHHQITRCNRDRVPDWRIGGVMVDVEAGAEAPRSQYLVYAVMGAVDAAVSPLVTTVRKVQRLTRRSDLGALASDGGSDLAARGKLAAQRRAHVPEAHLETLARQVMAMRPPRAEAAGGTQDG